MNPNIISRLHQQIETRNKQFVEEARGDNLVDAIVLKKLAMNKKRGAEIVKSYVEGDITRTSTFEDYQYVDYKQHNEYLIKINDHVYMEEQIEYRRATFFQDELINDEMIEVEEQEREAIKVEEMLRETSADEPKRSYNRREAVRYAERWWDDYNPEYKKFTNNCTNFISQCLHAGGAKMSGHPDRSKGWWFRSNNWSFSWSVAHAFRWYLSGSNAGLRGEEKESASELELGMSFVMILMEMDVGSTQPLS
ncbi:hypothetical protein JCM9140_1751 [Halalkalibacter wakoensis JCM 9140]|uniref:Putative amidase domain-containing protein n=1 Tax=Halalkalibacter wakoensis JCM 9140 TaxID=1236970 RepID=W4Q191_9BACI|nr:hypothetical protein JCM9140_1751 [Halalkalibacter wakoensis JCM 9140]